MDRSYGCKITRRTWWWRLELLKKYGFWDMYVFVMHYTYGVFRSFPTYRVYRLYDMTGTPTCTYQFTHTNTVTHWTIGPPSTDLVNDLSCTSYSNNIIIILITWTAGQISEMTPITTLFSHSSVTDLAGPYLMTTVTNKPVHQHFTALQDLHIPVQFLL